MQGRTFFRIMMDSLFVNNALCKAISSLVNFCNEQRYYSHKELKFLEKMPLNNVQNKSVYTKKFIFNSSHNSGVDYK